MKAPNCPTSFLHNYCYQTEIIQDFGIPWHSKQEKAKWEGQCPLSVTSSSNYGNHSFPVPMKAFKDMQALCQVFFILFPQTPSKTCRLHHSISSDIPNNTVIGLLLISNGLRAFVKLK